MNSENTHIILSNDFNISSDIIPSVIIQTVKKIPKNEAYQYKEKSGQWQTATWYETLENILNLAVALAESGLKPGDKVALIADNRYEWILADMAIQFNGCVSVPRGSDSTEEELSYIMNHSESRMIIAENNVVTQKVFNYARKNNISKVVVMDMTGINDPLAVSFEKLLESGAALRPKWENEIINRLKSLKKEDIYTIIYTSGTTGVPKGVMATHGNIIHQITEVPPFRGMVFGKDRWLSILPIWHVFERTAEYITIATGGKTIYTNIRNLKSDIREQKPTLMASAPRLWETVYLGIQKTIDSGSGVKKVLFSIAYNLSSFKGRVIRFLKGNELHQKKPNAILNFFRGIIYILGLIPAYPFYLLFDFIVLSKIRAATGGKLKATISGGGALPRHVDEFFNNIGIPVLEGYGMTETAPVIAARDLKKLVIGSVGRIIQDVSVEIRDFEGKPLSRGEKGIVWVKGPNVMKGYYKMPEKTSETIINGWLNTGDMGFISFNNTLTLTGRAKDTIVLLSGENIEPGPIEEKLIQSRYIDMVMITGQDKKFLTCIVYPNLEALAEKMSVDPSVLTIGRISDDKEVRDLFLTEIKTYTSSEFGFKYFEKVQDFRFADKPFEVGDEITSLGKMKRHIITEKYAIKIASMYEN